jgi:putative aminopeptidase FrvX
MHSPNEIVALEDLTNCACLIAAYVKGLKKDTGFVR